jgi:hypothetical protein
MSGLPGQWKHYASKRGASYCGAKEWRREAGAIESDELVQELSQREDAKRRVDLASESRARIFSRRSCRVSSGSGILHLGREVFLDGLYRYLRIEATLLTPFPRLRPWSPRFMSHSRELPGS